MLEPIVGFFEKLIDDFSWRRLTLLMSTIVFLLVCLWTYESYTADFQLTKLERQTALLNDLSKLGANEAVEKDKQLVMIYSEILQSLNTLAKQSKNQQVISKPTYQALAALLPWIIFSVLLLFIKQNSITQAITGMLIFAIPLSVVGYWLPAFDRSWLNYLFYPAMSFCLSVVFVMWWQSRKSNIEGAD